MAAPTGATMAPSVFVTGGNAGIGLALCKQLAGDHGWRVFLGSRSLKRGEAALKEVEAYAAGKPSAGPPATLVQCDTASDDSVSQAAEQVKAALEGQPLYAVVNNAGTGLQHNVSEQDVINTNFFGPKRVCEAFLPMLQDAGRIVNVGSGAGPIYTGSCTDIDVKRKLVSWKTTLDELVAFNTEPKLSELLTAGRMGAYGLSKATLAVYGMWLSQQPEVTGKSILVNTITPGFIDTAMTKGFGATKPPEEGTVSILHCLTSDASKLGSGFYYGSDAVRSPLHFMRNPGEPEYDGVEPTFE
mmetsp:Transcript_87872/g.253444  ORF Transcript_87872/g.253444 Transcript_87872/m.253444 type:complete len:300 (+) Transcript_87872:80-979(+)